MQAFGFGGGPVNDAAAGQEKIRIPFEIADLMRLNAPAFYFESRSAMRL